MLALAGQLLTGRYVATDYADRSEAEWPPHPARVYSALVAAYADDPQPDLRAALLWLEALPPPQIAASDASHRDVVTVFVPVNDQTLGTDTGPRGAALPSKLSDAELATAQALLPEHRKRQPRTFPSVTPDQEDFALIWPDAEPTPALRAALDQLCARVHRLGHSSSLVSLHLPAQAPEPTWLPAPDGDLTLRTVEPGQLAALEEGYALHQETLPRVMPAAATRYACITRNTGVTSVTTSYFSSDFIILKRTDGPALPLWAAHALARAVRGALLRYAADPRAEVLSGHQPHGPPSGRPHLAVVPLPFVGREHADGTLKGVALVLPRDAGAAELDTLSQALGAWEDAHRTGEHADTEHPPLPVRMGRDGCVSVEVCDHNLPTTLKAETWCRPARTWVSVTPVALDHNPGELRRNPRAEPATEARRLDAVLARAEASLRESVRRLGLPEPATVLIHPGPLVQGGRPVRAFPPLRAGPHPRVLVHAEITFETAVSGPVLLGAGRYLGYGLMRPVGDPP